MKKQIALIVSAAMIFSSAASYAAFTDVGEGSPYFQAVNCLVTKNIVLGYPDGSFMPDRPVTLGELKAMISRAAGTEYDESVFLQTDAVTLNDAASRIYFAANMDPLDPLPKRAATRGEAARMIYDAFARRSVENISYILNSVSAEPHPIGTQAIEDVKDFLTDALKGYGYEVEHQDFGYLKESITDRETLFGNEYVFAPDFQARDGVATNIIARKKAAVNTDKTVIVSTHYDTTSKVIGAIDNGSGVSAVAELARELAYEKLGYNLEIIFFSAEELNLGGSKYFAKTLDPEEADNVLFNINIDCVGENNSYYPEVWTNHGLDKLDDYTAEHLPEQIELFEKSKALVNSLTPVLDKFGIKTNPNMMPASDHVSLEQVGIPSMVLYQRNDRTKVWEDEEAEKLENIDVNKISYTVDAVKAMLIYKNQ